MKYGVYVGDVLLRVISQIQFDLLVFYFGDKPFDTMDVRPVTVN